MLSHSHTGTVGGSFSGTGGYTVRPPMISPHSTTFRPPQNWAMNNNNNGTKYPPSNQGPYFPQHQHQTSHLQGHGSIKTRPQGMLLPLPPSSAEYFGQFQHLMQQTSPPFPIPSPIIPHQYYSYMMQTHSENYGISQTPAEGFIFDPTVEGFRVWTGGHGGGYAQEKYSGRQSSPKQFGEKGQGEKLMPGYRLLKSPTLTHMICSVCCKKEGRLCTACGHMAYCSTNCQRIDWPRHKYAECMPPVVFDEKTIFKQLTTKEKRNNAENEPSPEKDEKGVGKDKYTGKLFSRRFIKQGESIQSMKAIMMASNDKGLPHPPDSILCLDCCRWYQSSTGYRCSKCQWPVCSFECENGPLHSTYECPVFKRNEIVPPTLPQDLNQFYDDAILALRCILMKICEPSKFEQLYKWKDMIQTMTKTSIWMDYDTLIKTFLLDECRVLELVQDLTVKDIEALLVVIDACSIIMDDRVAFRETEHEKTFHCAKYVMLEKLFMTQECRPNCKWSVSHGTKLEDCLLRVHAATDIQTGNYVTTCFTSLWQYGASFSKRYVNFRFDFVCKCRRCKDPTELGTFFSGVKCQECDLYKSTGYLLPRDPFNPASEWECQNKDCNQKTKGCYVMEDVNKLNKELGEYQNNYWKLVAFIYQNDRTKLHPNHFLILKAGWTCMELFWGSIKGLPFFSWRYEFFNSCIHVAKKVLATLDLILPGASIQRGRILFLLSLAEAFKDLRDYRRFNEWGTGEESKCIPKPFWQLITMQKEAFEILVTEPYGSMENRMAVMLQETIEDQIDLLCHTPIDVPMDGMMIYVLHKIYTRFACEFYQPMIPLFEDEDINKFVISTGPCASHMVTRKSSVLN